MLGPPAAFRQRFTGVRRFRREFIKIHQNAVFFVLQTGRGVEAEGGFCCRCHADPQTASTHASARRGARVAALARVQKLFSIPTKQTHTNQDLKPPANKCLHAPPPAPRAHPR